MIVVINGLKDESLNHLNYDVRKNYLENLNKMNDWVFNKNQHIDHLIEQASKGLLNSDNIEKTINSIDVLRYCENVGENYDPIGEFYTEEEWNENRPKNFLEWKDSMKESLKVFNNQAILDEAEGYEAMHRHSHLFNDQEVEDWFLKIQAEQEVQPLNEN